MDRIVVCSDGGVRQRGKYGAIAFVLASDARILYEHSALYRQVTTAEMEIRAMWCALQEVRCSYPNCRVLVYSDFRPLIHALVEGDDGVIAHRDRFKKSKSRHQHGELINEIRELLREGDVIKWMPRNSTIFLSRADELINKLLDGY